MWADTNPPQLSQSNTTPGTSVTSTTGNSQHEPSEGGRDMRRKKAYVLGSSETSRVAVFEKPLSEGRSFLTEREPSR